MRDLSKKYILCMDYGDQWSLMSFDTIAECLQECSSRTASFIITKRIELIEKPESES